MSAPGSEGFARRRGLLITLTVVAALLTLAPLSASPEDGDNGVAVTELGEQDRVRPLSTTLKAEAYCESLARAY